MLWQASRITINPSVPNTTVISSCQSHNRGCGGGTGFHGGLLWQ